MKKYFNKKWLYSVPLALSVATALSPTVFAARSTVGTLISAAPGAIITLGIVSIVVWGITKDIRHQKKSYHTPQYQADDSKYPTNHTEAISQEIRAYDPEFSDVRFLSNAEKIFDTILRAYKDNNLDLLKHNHLEWVSFADLKLEKITNISKSYIYNHSIGGDMDYVDVLIQALNENNSLSVYSMKLQRSIADKTKIGKGITSPVCPNCGAPARNNQPFCEYCGSKIITNESMWKLTKFVKVD